MPFEPKDITADEVRTLKDRCNSIDGGITLTIHQAKSIVRNRKILDALNDLESNGNLEEKVEWMLRRFRENLNVLDHLP